MFEEEIEQPFVRRGLGPKGWAIYLQSLFVASIVFVFVLRHLSQKDDLIAERERVILAKIVEIHKEKNDPTDYVYQFEGRTYFGRDDGNYLDLAVGGTARVFVDSKNPQISGLRSFRFKSSLNHGFSNFLIYVAIGSAFASAILWMKVLNARDAGSDEKPA